MAKGLPDPVHVCVATASGSKPTALLEGMLGGLINRDTPGEAGYWGIDSRGFFCGQGECRDAFARRFSNDLRWLSNPERAGGPTPLLAQPCPEPTPVPTPRPSPPSPIVGGGVPVKEGECPDDYPRKPDYVKVGGTARRAPANPYSWLNWITPIMTHAEYCLAADGSSRGVPCEQWIPCALQGLNDPRDPKSSWSPAVRAWGPGFDGDDAERRSRPAEKWEVPCEVFDPGNRFCYINYYLTNFVVGEHGSPPGRYTVCAAPTVHDIRGPHDVSNGECKDFEFTLP
jgi:hypothetical protein